MHVSDRTAKERDFGQRGKLCRKNVFDAGNKKASNNASHKQPLASLRHCHSHKTPTPAVTRNQLCTMPRPACLPHRLCTGCCRVRHRLPGEGCPSREEPDYLSLLLTTEGGSHLLRWEKEGETAMICHLYKVSRTPPWRWGHLNSPHSISQCCVLS